MSKGEGKRRDLIGMEKRDGEVSGRTLKSTPMVAVEDSESKRSSQ
jgi:hypothetical protein